MVPLDCSSRSAFAVNRHDFATCELTWSVTLPFCGKRILPKATSLWTTTISLSRFEHYIMILSVKPLFEECPGREFGWGEFSQGEFVDNLDHQKAVLIRREEKSLSVEEFGELLVGFDLEHYPYVGGAAPRTIIPVSAGKDIIFTANERYVTTIRHPSLCRTFVTQTAHIFLSIVLPQSPFLFTMSSHRPRTHRNTSSFIAIHRPKKEEKHQLLIRHWCIALQRKSIQSSLKNCLVSELATSAPYRLRTIPCPPLDVRTRIPGTYKPHTNWNRSCPRLMAALGNGKRMARYES